MKRHVFVYTTDGGYIKTSVIVAHDRAEAREAIIKKDDFLRFVHPEDQKGPIEEPCGSLS